MEYIRSMPPVVCDIVSTPPAATTSIPTVSTSDCVLRLNDIKHEIPSRLTVVEDKLLSLESKLNELSAMDHTKDNTLPSSIGKLINIISNPNDCDYDDNDLISSANLLKSLCDETMRRISAKKQVVFFNVPDRYNLCTLMNKVNTVISLPVVSASRLRKRSSKFSCPILVTFRSAADCDECIQHSTNICSSLKIPNVFIKRSLTALERISAKKQSPTSATTMPSSLPREPLIVDITPTNATPAVNHVVPKSPSDFSHPTTHPSPTVPSVHKVILYNLPPTFKLSLLQKHLSALFTLHGTLISSRRLPKKSFDSPPVELCLTSPVDLSSLLRSKQPVALDKCAPDIYFGSIATNTTGPSQIKQCKKHLVHRNMKSNASALLQQPSSFSIKRHVSSSIHRLTTPYKSSYSPYIHRLSTLPELAYTKPRRTSVLKPGLLGFAPTLNTCSSFSHPRRSATPSRPSVSKSFLYPTPPPVPPLIPSQTTAILPVVQCLLHCLSLMHA